MQKHSFTNGGFVIHNINFDKIGGRFSAWFDKDGTLQDAEYIDIVGRSRKVGKRHIERLKTIGRVWKDK